MPPHDGEIQRRLKEYENPRYGHRRAADGSIEKDLFDGSLPPGWVRSPADVDAMPTVAPAALDGESDARADLTGHADSHTIARPGAPYDRHKFHVLRLELQRRTGKGTKPGTNKAELVKMLEALDGEGNPNA